VDQVCQVVDARQGTDRTVQVRYVYAIVQTSSSVDPLHPRSCFFTFPRIYATPQYVHRQLGSFGSIPASIYFNFDLVSSVSRLPSSWHTSLLISGLQDDTGIYSLFSISSSIQHGTTHFRSPVYDIRTSASPSTTPRLHTQTT